MNGSHDILLQTRGLKKVYQSRRMKFWKQPEHIKAVDDVSLEIRNGETLGLVGESGCGKSTLAKMILGLEKPSAGEILFEGERTADYSTEALREFRSKVQIIFQDPYASLNPRRTAGKTIGEPFFIQRKTPNKDALNNHILELLKVVGLAAEHQNRYPHEFSGGQRQRIGIARALSVKPALVIADEPVSALDVSVQAQILNLLKDLQDDFKLTYLFISHNLGVIRHMSDRVAVMYLGKIVETGTNEEIFQAPRHPYTRLLLSAILELHTKKWEKGSTGKIDLQSKTHPNMCRFYPRCPIGFNRCISEEPRITVLQGEHAVACHLATT